MLYGKKEITISLHVRFEKWDKEKGETHEEAARKRKYVNFVQDVSEKVLLESGGWVVPEEENNPADPGESGTQGVGGAVQERD
uniref:Uncharacterized protein n=1 Tax=viral metagenome TaxID=1070528 RepID=A0A6M3L879_9ZZZZ